MKNHLSSSAHTAIPIYFDTAVPRLDQTVSALQAWREIDLLRDEDAPESPQHLLTGLQLVFQVARTASLNALCFDSGNQYRRLLDELMALRQAFAPAAEIDATLRKLATCRRQPQDDAHDDEQILIDAGHVFDELAVRLRSTQPTRGIYGVAIN